MTTQAETVTLTLTERLTLAVGRLGGRKRTAEYFGIDPSTITRWTQGTTVPPVMTVRALALASGVPFEYLSELLPRVDSNHQPADWAFALLFDPVAEAEAILTAVAL